MTEAQLNRKLKKIKRFKKALREERKRIGGLHDGGGLRYAIAELYFEIGNYSKTNLYLNWFYKNFPDDATFSYFQLGAAVTYFKVKKRNLAIRELVALNTGNLYIVGLLLKRTVVDHEKYEWNEYETLAWAKGNLAVLETLPTPDFLEWLDTIYEHEV